MKKNLGKSVREEGIEPTSSAWKADDVTVYPHPLICFLVFITLLESDFDSGSSEGEARTEA